MNTSPVNTSAVHTSTVHTSTEHQEILDANEPRSIRPMLFAGLGSAVLGLSGLYFQSEAVRSESAKETEPVLAETSFSGRSPQMTALYLSTGAVLSSAVTFCLALMHIARLQDGEFASGGRNSARTD